MRQYETALIESESVALLEQLKTDTSISLVVANASKLLRSILRLLGGEEPESAGTPPEYDFLGLRVTGEMDDSLDRECELHRLQKENEELRLLLELSKLEPPNLPPMLPRVAPELMVPRRPKNIPRDSHMSFGDSATTTEDVEQHMESLQLRLDRRDGDDELEILS